MSLNSGAWRGWTGAWGEGLRRGLWALALGGLGLVLVWEAGRSREEGARAARQEAAVTREIERLRRENAALREELGALETDPVYVEALLRRWKRAGPGERLVE